MPDDDKLPKLDPIPHLSVMAAPCEQLVKSDDDEDTNPGLDQGSLEPGDPICKPVKVERKRRKAVDVQIIAQLTTIRKLSVFVASGVAAMVLFALLEYGGVIGDGHKSVWAKAVIDGLFWAFGIGK